MKISVYGTSIRPEYWMSVYQQLSQNDVEFEILFSGPNPPSFELPANFIFIHTNVKPAQAAEIVSRSCTGNFMLNIADDINFPEHVLDIYISEYNKLNDKNIMLSGVYGRDGIKYPDEEMRFNIENQDSALLPLCGFIETSLRRKIGSIDRNFIGTYWDLDIALRFRDMGGKIYLINDLLLSEDVCKRVEETSLSFRCGQRDSIFLKELYGNDGLLQRTRPVEEFSSDNILTVTQGNVI